MTIDYGRSIRNARLARNWSREHLADKAGVSAESVESIESGKPSTDIERILDTLGLVEVHTLMPSLRANFLTMVEPIIEQIPESQMPIVMAAVLDIVGRAAAGRAPAPTVGQLNVVSGKADIDQQIG